MKIQLLGTCLSLALALAATAQNYGVGKPPHEDFVPVPASEAHKVKAALDIVRDIIENSDKHPLCHERIALHCDEDGLRLDEALLWKTTDGSEFGSSVRPNHITYENEALRYGARFLAAVFLHELVHNCTIPEEHAFFNQDESEIFKTEKACGLPWKNKGEIE